MIQKEPYILKKKKKKEDIIDRIQIILFYGTNTY